MSKVLATHAIRDTAINAAIAAGRIAPDTRPAYERLYAAAPTEALIALAAPPPPARVVVPAAQVAPVPDADGYPGEWLTGSERATLAAAHGGATPRLTIER